MLNGVNYSNWKEKILFTLGCMNLDVAFHVDNPPVLLDSSTLEEEVEFDKLE